MLDLHESPTDHFGQLNRANALLEQLKAVDEDCHHGIYGKTLPDFRELDPETLANTLFGSENPVYTGVAAFPLKDNDNFVGGFGYSLMHFMIFRDGTGVAWNREWKYGSKNPTGKERKRRMGKDGYLTPNTMVVRFYGFGCLHEYHEMSGEELSQCGVKAVFPCEHGHLCNKCGHFFVVDSSD